MDLFRPLAARLRNGFEVTSLEYHLVGKSGMHTPRRAFRETIVELALVRQDDALVSVRLRATIGLAPKGDRARLRLLALEVLQSGDEDVARWMEDVGWRIREPRTNRRAGRP